MAGVLCESINHKGLYEAKYPQTKHGGAPGKAGGGKLAKDAESASFAKDTAAKTKQSARTLESDLPKLIFGNTDTSVQGLEPPIGSKSAIASVSLERTFLVWKITRKRA